MQQTVETIGALERRLDVTVPAADIDREIKARLNKLARTTRMPGFRPGKVPLKMVEQSYGPQVQAEVLNDKVGQAFESAVNAAKLRVAGTPKLEPKADATGSDLAFTATFEVFPDIAIGDVSGAEVQRATCSVDDAAIDRTIDMMRRQRTQYVPVQRAAGDADRVIVDFAGTRDGAAFEGGTAQDFPFTLGGGRMLAEFETAVQGMSAGETKTFPLTFPADYQAKDLAGQTVQFEVTLKGVEQPVLPPIDADFARSLGVADGDVGKMRDEIRGNLQREVGTRLRARTRESALNALLGTTRFEVPKALVADDQKTLADMTREDLVRRGVAAKDAPLPLELFATQAERRVRLGLLVGELVRVHGLQARQDQVRKMVEDIAQSYERPQEVIHWYLSDRKRLSDLEALALEDNVTNWVLQHARVVDTPVAFDDLMGNTQQ